MIASTTNRMTSGEPRPVVSTSASIITFGHLTWLGWTWLVALVGNAIVSVVISIADGEMEDSLWQSAGAGWQRWVLFAAGVVTATTFVKMLVTNGVTRRQVSSAAAASMAVLAVLGAAVITIGYALENLFWDRQGWVQRLEGGGDFEAGDLPRIAIESAIHLAVYFATGWIVGVNYRRFGAVGGTLLLVPSAIPVVLSEVLTSKDYGGANIDVLPDVIDSPPLVLTALGGAALAAATVLVARRLTSELTI